jgi:hypothetical protein
MRCFHPELAKNHSPRFFVYSACSVVFLSGIAAFGALNVSGLLTK